MNIQHKLIKFLLLCALFELFVGGSGQVFKIWGVPLRQVLFVLILLLWCLCFISEKSSFPNGYSLWSILFILTWLCFSSLLGVINGKDNVVIFNDVSPMLYFLMYFPLSFSIRREIISYNMVIRVLTISSLVVSLSVVIAFFALKIVYGNNGYQFNQYLFSLIGYEVFWFRPGGWVFYPGLFYVLVSCLVIYEEFLRKGVTVNFKLVVFSLGTISIIVSMTKGLLLSFCFGIILATFLSRISIKNLSIIVSFISILVFISLSYFDFSRILYFSGDSGVQNRVTVFHESINAIADSPIVGNGFATELPTKKQHQENSYLDIWVEQGAIGLLAYAFLLVLCFKNFHSYLGLKVALASVLIMSSTNPYINNPIGIGLIILLLVFNSCNSNKGQFQS